MTTEYRLDRISSAPESTIGILFNKNNQFLSFTLEDQHRDIKVADETRIPAGTYQVKLRNAGGMTKRYAERFDFHEGMLWLQDVPNFKWIYLHVGNLDKHTSGCILVGDGAIQNITRQGKLLDSSIAYERVYKEMAEDIEEQGSITLQVRDLA